MEIVLNKTPLSGLPNGTAVEGWVLIQDCKILSSRTNQPYVSWKGLDALGIVVRGTMFNDDMVTLPNFKENDVVCVYGSSGDGKLGYSIWAKKMVKIDDQTLIDSFKDICIPTVPKEELNGYIEYLSNISTSFSNPQINELSNCLFGYMAPFLTSTPAAKTNHEALRGGLAKHAYEVVRAVEGFCSLKKELNRDVLVFSALYHDVGKCKEYNDLMCFLPEGRLTSHSAIAIELITEARCRFGVEIDPFILRQIKHCIMSHHGEHSEILPATKEAIVLHYCDMVMAKVGHIDECIRRSEFGGDGWGKFSTALGTTPYIADFDDKKA